jgi:hypothetical protein
MVLTMTFSEDSNSSSIENPSAKGEKKVNQTTNILDLQENGSTPSTDADDQLLMTLGYRPELRRNFSYLTAFGQSFGAINSIFNLAILRLCFVRIQVDVHPTTFHD